MYLVSACLAGYPCRYDGNSNPNEKVIQLVKEGKAIPVCPEQLGGLSTPRESSEIIQRDGKKYVISKTGEDVTKQFQKGAKSVVAIAKALEIKKAILKSKSPSCGCGKVYDGTFSGKIIQGNGLAVERLLQEGIQISTEDDLF